MPAHQVTLADVAARAGVSLATASRVLNGSARRVRPELRERVAAIGAELGYLADPAAQAMARGASDLVGVVVADLADPWDAQVTAGVLDTVAEHGLLAAVTSTGRDPMREVGQVGVLRRHRARAVVLVSSRTPSRSVSARLATEIRSIEDYGARVAVLGQRSLGTDTVLVENRAGAKALVQALVEQGFDRFHVLAGPKSHVTSRDRSAGFRDGAGRGRLGQVRECALTRESAYGATLELAAAVDLRGSCLLAVSDTLAVGALAALRERRLKVPQEVALAGFDDLPVARDLKPALSTVALPLRELGRRVAALAVRPDDGVVLVEKVPGEVVLRASTRRRR